MKVSAAPSPGMKMSTGVKMNTGGVPSGTSAGAKERAAAAFQGQQAAPRSNLEQVQAASATQEEILRQALAPGRKKLKTREVTGRELERQILAELQTEEDPNAVPGVDASQNPQGKTETPSKGQASNSDVGRESSTRAEVTQPLDPQQAQLAKARRALQVKEQELKKREAALQAKESGKKTPQPDWIDPADLEKDPLGVLRERGIGYDRLTQAALADQASPEVQALKAHITQLEQKLEKKFEERDQATEAKVLEEIAREAEYLAESSKDTESDEFQLIRTTNSYPDVVALVKKTYKETGIVLSTKEAMAAIEATLWEDIDRIAELPRFKQRFNKIAEPQTAAQAAAAAQRAQAQPNTNQQPRVVRTLTSRDTAAPAHGLDKRSRALMAALGQLKR
jgi:hypothetical protein